MENNNFVDYPFTSSGVNLISRIYNNSDIARMVAKIPVSVFNKMNDKAVQDCIGDISKLSTAELLSELERVNEGGTRAFILLGAN